MAGLRRTVPLALESADVDLIRKFFRKYRDYNHAYLNPDGNATTGRAADVKVKEYKSHRRVPTETI